MSTHVLSCNPCISNLGTHNPSAAILVDGTVTFAVEEERIIRDKNTFEIFPRNSIEQCLEHCGVELTEIDQITIPWDPTLQKHLFAYDIKNLHNSEGVHEMYRQLKGLIKRRVLDPKGYSRRILKNRLKNDFDQVTELPDIAFYSHHRSHAASAYRFSPFDEAIVVTIDGQGEYDSTVIWKGTSNELSRLRTYKYPNSLGFFYAIITDFLGYEGFRDEGKVMGLAPYGSQNKNIEQKLRKIAKPGIDYDVSQVTIPQLEAIFGRERKYTPTDFTKWEKDLAYTTQLFLEETVTDIVSEYVEESDINKVCLAGGVALNCKMNQQVRELGCVDKLFVQPISHDGGSILGAGSLAFENEEVSELRDVYWGEEHSVDEIQNLFEKYKLTYESPNDLYDKTATLLSNGDLVGWYQGRLEMGPRALGNRSILADPRVVKSRDEVNKHVKNREAWRPFAPVMLESAASTYLKNPAPAPFMIQTFSVRENAVSNIPAVVHPGDHSTRPQTVTKFQNPQIAKLLEAFEQQTGVPVLLNTSFNNSGEPIVRTPTDAIRMFMSSGLDALVMEDFLVSKA